MRFVFTFIVDLSPPPKLSAEELMFLEPSPSKPAVSNIGSTCFFALGRETSGRFMLCNFCRFSPFNRVLDLFSVMLFLSLKVLPLFWVAIKGWFKFVGVCLPSDYSRMAFTSVSIAPFNWFSRISNKRFSLFKANSLFNKVNQIHLHFFVIFYNKSFPSEHILILEFPLSNDSCNLIDLFLKRLFVGIVRFRNLLSRRFNYFKLHVLQWNLLL